MPGVDVALFIDWENLDSRSPERTKEVFEMAARHGRVVVARAYHDWAAIPTGAREQYELYVEGIEPVFVPCKRPDGTTIKNGVDVKMSADCLEFSHLCANIGTFVLVSCDVDFVHVAQSLRRRGLRVEVIGREKGTAKRLAQASDGVAHYAAKTEAPPEDKCVRAIDRALIEILRAAQAKRGNADPLPLSALKTGLLARMPGFKEKDYGSSTFGKFVQARANAGVLNVKKIGTLAYASLPE